MKLRPIALAKICRPSPVGIDRERASNVMDSPAANSTIGRIIAVELFKRRLTLAGPTEGLVIRTVEITLNSFTRSVHVSTSYVINVQFFGEARVAIYIPIQAKSKL